MIARVVAASAVFATGVFVAAVVSLAVLHVRRSGVDFKGVFEAARFASFLAAATVWALAGLLYLIQAAGPTSSGLGGLHGAVVIVGWAASLGFWLAANRVLASRP